MTKLICYLSNGYPSIEKTLETADLYVEGGCDIIEIDIPTDNPFLDNEFIGGRMRQAFAQDQNYDLYLDTIRRIREKHPHQEMLVVLYEHSLKKIGVEKFTEFCRQHHTEDIILVGNENNLIKNELMNKGIRVSSYIQYHLPDEEMNMAKNTNGFIYLQAKAVGKVREGCETLQDCIAFLRNVGLHQPIYCGVGISTKEDVAMVANAGGNAAFIGSAVLKKQDQSKELVSFIQKLKEGTITG